MSSVAVIGSGYVGLATAVCLAEIGHRVIGVDIDEAKIAKLRGGTPTIYEPGLDELIASNLKAGRLTFTSDYDEAIPGADFVFIAVGTPPGRRGEADLHFVKQAAKAVAGAMKKTVTIVNKSTVPIGTGNIVARIVGENLGDEIPFYVVSNPEFLREGSAVYDFMHPDRLVFGSHDETAARAVAALYSKLDTKILITDLHTAEMIKYASNAFLATRISFINEMARICERVDADVKVVSEGMGLDRRIGPLFLDAGIGYGGSCFPKDVKALIRTAEEAGGTLPVLEAVERVNSGQKRVLARKILARFGGKLAGMRIAVWGLAFKPNTDDMREAPSRVLIEELLANGATVSAYDPVAMPAAKSAFAALAGIRYADSPLAALDGADALAVVTEWQEFRSPDFRAVRERLKTPAIFDGRNLYDPEEMKRCGLEYYPIGRAAAKADK